MSGKLPRSVFGWPHPPIHPVFPQIFPLPCPRTRDLPLPPTGGGGRGQWLSQSSIFPGRGLFHVVLTCHKWPFGGSFDAVREFYKIAISFPKSFQEKGFL